MKKTGYPGVTAVKAFIVFQNCLKNRKNYISEELFELNIHRRGLYTRSVIYSVEYF